MLDELLGRATLKERIDELEDEKRRLEERLAAESDRRADAVSARQDAEERVNHLEDRVTELEDRVERANAGEADLSFRGTEAVRNDRVRAVLDRLDSVDAGPEGALTAAVDDVPDEVRAAFGDRAPLVARASPCVAVTDDAGLVSAALAPPVQPEPAVTWSDGFALDRAWFEPEAVGSFALALVRSDLFALGEYRDGEQVEFRGFESDVKGDHSKGGFSQGRFERRRDAQIDEHLRKARDAMDATDADRLFVVGERSVIHEFAEDADATAAVDATGAPREALEAAFEDFWTTRLYLV